MLFRSLESVSIGSSVANIYGDAFGRCNKLRNIEVDIDNKTYSSANRVLLSKDGKKLILGVNGDVVIPSGVTSVEASAFYYCNELASVAIPGTVTSIGSSAFYECDKLTSVTIPDSVASIGMYAFYCSGITDVTIGGSVKVIGDAAFNSCNSLTNVSMRGDAPNLGSSVFPGYWSNDKCMVRLPQGNTTYTVTDGKWQGMTVAYYTPEDLPIAGDVYKITFRNMFAIDQIWECSAGSALGPLPTPEHEGWIFRGWFDSNNVEATAATIMPNADLYLTALWEQESSPDPDPDPDPDPETTKYNVAFHPAGR